eukprot:TRINITY_DN4126_c0_g1_i1.p1 TRINITY_DN4126_c0_g1~~TRINITY_DN4126_c0_g1_i1.p1  ORF type:complete len:499 (+),score=93.91 TRINITY_DN4126_c0_g1_i1:120-1616(+)
MCIRDRANMMSLDTPLERLLGDQAQVSSGAFPLECHDFGEVLLHVVPASVRKGTHKLLLNHPKFHVEFRVNREYKGPPRSVKIWAKIGPKGVRDRSNVIDNAAGHPSLQCNHELDKVVLEPPHRIPHNEGVQPIHIKGKVSGTVVPSEAVLAQAQFEVPGTQQCCVIHLQGDFNTSFDGTRHQLILPRGGAAKGLSHLFTFSVQLLAEGEDHAHIFTRDFDVVFAADRKLRKTPMMAAELSANGAALPTPRHNRAFHTQGQNPTKRARTEGLTPAECDADALGSLANFAYAAAAEQGREPFPDSIAADNAPIAKTEPNYSPPRAVMMPPRATSAPLAHTSSFTAPADIKTAKPLAIANQATEGGTVLKQPPKILVKSRVCFHDEATAERALQVWDRVFSPETNPSVGMVWHWEMVHATTMEITELTTSQSWLRKRAGVRRHPEYEQARGCVHDWQSSVFWGQCVCSEDKASMEKEMMASNLERFMSSEEGYTGSFLTV